MATELNHKGRNVLDEPAIQLLSLILSALRKHRDEGTMLDDLGDTRDVLAALTISGYAIVPQGSLDVLRKILVNSDP